MLRGGGAMANRMAQAQLGQAEHMDARGQQGMGLLSALARRKGAAQKTPEELDAMSARALLDRAKAGNYGREKTVDPDKAENLKLRNQKLKNQLGGGTDGGPDPMLHLDDYDLDPSFSLKPEVAEKLRDAQGQTRLMSQNLGELMQLYKQHGNAVLPGPVRARMTALARHLQLSAKGKAMFELGVLAGPDLDLLENTIPNPSSRNATMADFFGGGETGTDSLERLRVMQEQVGKKFEAAVGSRGYRRSKRKGGNVELDGGGGGGLPTDKQRRLEELRAKKAAGALK